MRTSQSTDAVSTVWRSEAGSHSLDLDINGRKLTAINHADDVVWFDFKTLCDGPRSQNDYIELAREFHAVIISNVPVLGNDKDDQARRFINLIDEFYDRNVKVHPFGGGADQRSSMPADGWGSSLSGQSPGCWKCSPVTIWKQRIKPDRCPSKRCPIRLMFDPNA